MATNRGGPNRCTSEACYHRVHDLELQIKSLTRDLALKEGQLLSLTSAGSSGSANRAASPLFPSTANAPSQASPTERQQKLMMKQQQQYHQQQLQQQQQDSSHRMAELMMQLGELQADNLRLQATLKAEDKMKQELIACYHSSMREITDLNCK